MVLLVLVDEALRTHGEQGARARDLHRLIHTIPVGEDRGLAVLPETRDHIERTRVEVALERDVEDRAIDVAEAPLVAKGTTESPEGLWIIDDAALVADLLVQRPEPRS